MNIIKSTDQSTPGAYDSRPWWLALLLIVLVGAGLRFTGYNYYLPYIDGDSEKQLNVGALTARGLYNQYFVLPGYSPGIFWADGIAQFIVEQVTHRSADNDTAGYHRHITIFRRYGQYVSDYLYCADGESD